jgi:hypothetical protein
MVRRGDGALAVATRILRLVAASYLLEHGGVDPLSVNEVGESAADLLHQRLDEVGVAVFRGGRRLRPTRAGRRTHALIL